jgi:hypothetical protein
MVSPLVHDPVILGVEPFLAGILADHPTLLAIQVCVVATVHSALQVLVAGAGDQGQGSHAEGQQVYDAQKAGAVRWFHFDQLMFE